MCIKKYIIPLDDVYLDNATFKGWTYFPISEINMNIFKQFP